MFRFFRRVDTRIFPRLRLHNFIKYKIESEPAKSFSIACVEDISASGILFVSKKELPAYSTIDVAINFPGMDSIEIKAEVVRAKRTASGEYQTGAHFIVIDETKKEQLAKRVEFILRKIRERKSFLGQIRRAFRRK